MDVIKSEGIAGLYSGLNSSLMGIAVTNGYDYIDGDDDEGCFIIDSRPSS